MRSSWVTRAIYIAAISSAAATGCSRTGHNESQSIASPQPTALSAKELLKLYDPRNLKEVTALAQLPTEIQSQMVKMAEPGQPFQETDFVDRNLPIARFLVAGINTGSAVVSFEQSNGWGKGGRAVIFVKWKSKWTKGPGWPIAPPSSLQALETNLQDAMERGEPDGY